MDGLSGIIFQKGLDHFGVERDLGPKLGFSVQFTFSGNFDLSNISIIFITARGRELNVSARSLCSDRPERYPTHSLSSKFINSINIRCGVTEVLDIGGRNRSLIDRSKQFPNASVTVFDILPGDNVDVVGDAHELSSYFPSSKFDYVISVSVFEHLIMPWKVALEICKVLKLGGFAMIHTHQSIGVHDYPWDYYRFSDKAWHSIFNRYTGFEIMEAYMDHQNFIVPYIIRDGLENAESSAGFENSTVVVKKIGDPSVEWNVAMTELISDHYPDTPDSFHL